MTQEAPCKRASILPVERTPLRKPDRAQSLQEPKSWLRPWREFKPAETCTNRCSKKPKTRRRARPTMSSCRLLARTTIKRYCPSYRKAIPINGSHSETAKERTPSQNFRSSNLRATQTRTWSCPVRTTRWQTSRRKHPRPKPPPARPSR